MSGGARSKPSKLTWSLRVIELVVLKAVVVPAAPVTGVALFVGAFGAGRGETFTTLAGAAFEADRDLSTWWGVVLGLKAPPREMSLGRLLERNSG